MFFTTMRRLYLEKILLVTRKLAIPSINLVRTSATQSWKYRYSTNTTISHMVARKYPTAQARNWRDCLGMVWSCFSLNAQNFCTTKFKTALKTSPTIVDSLYDTPPNLVSRKNAP